MSAQVEVELAVLEEAQMLIRSGRVERNGWHEWNVFSGRMDYREETEHSWLRRAIELAKTNIEARLNDLKPVTPAQKGEK